MTTTAMRRFYVDAPWGQIHCRSAAAGADLPCLLLLHQSPLSARNYDRVLPHLARWCRPVAIDTPGYGASDPPPGEWDVADYARVVERVADALEARSFFLFGRATGAVFAFEAAIAQPRRVRRLALHGVPVYTAGERADRLQDFAPPYRIDETGAHLAWIWNRIRGEYPHLESELANRFVADYLAAGADFAAAYRAIWRYDLAARAGAAPNTPLMLIGGANDRIATMHQRACRVFPAAQAVWLDDADDFAADRMPERFSALLERFFLGDPM